MGFVWRRENPDDGQSRKAGNTPSAHTRRALDELRGKLEAETARDAKIVWVVGLVLVVLLGAGVGSLVARLVLP